MFISAQNLVKFQLNSQNSDFFSIRLQVFFSRKLSAFSSCRSKMGVILVVKHSNNELTLSADCATKKTSVDQLQELLLPVAFLQGGTCVAFLPGSKVPGRLC